MWLFPLGLPKSTSAGDRWPDDVRLSDIEPLVTCQACCRHGADVHPNSIGK
jgi:hypothetical protein